MSSHNVKDKSETRKKRVSVKQDKDVYFKWALGKFPGVYLDGSDTPEKLADKAKYAYENGFPVYLVEDDFKRLDGHDVLTFLSNIGYVYLFVDYVNDNRTKYDCFSIKIYDYVRDTDMSKYNQKSYRTKEYYLKMGEKGRRVEGKPYKTPKNYEFPPHWVTISCKVTKIENG